MRRERRATAGGARANRTRCLTLRLKPEERVILLRACREHRSAIPSYLAARQEEVRILDALIAALA